MLAQNAPRQRWDGNGLPPFGRVLGVRNEVYQAAPGVSRSNLTTISRSPAHLLTDRLAVRERKDAWDWGEAFHVLTLQPDLWDERVAIKPTKGSAFALWRDGLIEASGKPPAEPGDGEADEPLAKRSGFEKDVWSKFADDNAARAWISVDQKAHIERMVQAVREHPYAGPLCDPDSIDAEVSYWWTDPETKVLCKCRPDAENHPHNLIVDLKSALDASYSGFAKSVAAYEYHTQDAHYRTGVTLSGGWAPRAFVFVVVEKERLWVKGPGDDKPRQTHAVGVYTLNEKLREHGRLLVRRRLHRYSDSKSADLWPAYPPEIRDLDIPIWGYRDNVS